MDKEKRMRFLLDEPLTAEPSAADGGVVDAALRQIDKRQQHAEQGSDLGSARILAAEVRRLRELVKFREGEVVTLLEYQRTLEAERDRAWAELANVRALQRLYEDVTR